MAKWSNPFPQFLSILLSSWARCVRQVCVTYTMRVCCSVCRCLFIRTCDFRIRIYTLCDCVCSYVASVFILRLICWGWTKPDCRRVSMTRNRTLSPHNLCSQPCDVHVRARKDEGEGILREGILGSSSQFVRAVCEKLCPEKLFSEPGCLREAVLEKPFSD